MKRIYFPTKNSIEDVIDYDKVDECTPIFIMQEGKLVGMVIKENWKGGGWIAKLGGPTGLNGHFDSRRQCVKDCIDRGYECYIA